MHEFFRNLMERLARRHPSNRTESRQKYPQTWWLMPPRWAKPWKPGGPVRHSWWGFPLRCLLERLCGLLTGHELSNTEWGYGGGKFIDRNCRWCDKVIQVPIIEDPPPNQALEDLSKLIK